MNAFSTIIADPAIAADPVCHRQRRAGLGQGERLIVQGGMALIDAVFVYAAAVIACGLHGIPLDHRTMDFAVLLPPLCVVLALFTGAYDRSILLRPVVSAARGGRALLYAAATIMLVLFVIKESDEVSRIASLLWVILALAAIAAARMFLAMQVRSATRGQVERILVIEDGRPSRDIAWARHADAMHMGIVPDGDSPDMLDRIGTLVHRMDRVIVCCQPDRRTAWARVLKGFDVQAEIVDETVDRLGVIGAGRAGAHGTLIVAAHPLALYNQVLKRGFDIAFAAAALIAALPIFAVVALAIVVEDRGPVFFRQNRVGQGNRSFRMLKFRSMRLAQCDDAANRLTQRGDPRVTRVGRFIRATSIDELPQLVNVLLGQMSIVGPRPHAAMAKAGDKLYWQVDRRYWERHALKPGLTGLAQVRGHRGATDHEDHLRNRLQADLEYLNGWSIWRDLRIVAATAKVLVHPQAF
ncbi:exopolysaccharide biosynthesis polyprenyl glycosylphosphotransferase [Croceicoccus naphthovorans]|uniref:exopolysaccharide biosynthesis polyprenyl glycosylphosphotransferase n=1 Tax=Croceicoccus naphthovorans TaxID=1348774 RepID=UPI00069DA072|nr:exopolysaccharide biosynthesis polyprenyl glycosylphosphotransferase [Croceicoccus naphthovorans]MBB3990394.1 exopolysaccharide biosynthesis polyprenyl glycosylphosphotransferase [Croceicoccus naphthovorans]